MAESRTAARSSYMCGKLRMISSDLWSGQASQRFHVTSASAPRHSLDQRCPDPDPVLVPLPVGGHVVPHDRLGGLLNGYSRAATAS